jgi:hypothetical protein
MRLSPVNIFQLGNVIFSEKETMINKNSYFNLKMFLPIDIICYLNLLNIFLMLYDKILQFSQHRNLQFLQVIFLATTP